MDDHENASTFVPLTMENANSGDPPSYFYEKEIEPEHLRSMDAYEILVKHSGIPEQDVLKHVTEQREKAWKVFPYPCIGRWQFLDCGISKSAVYPEVLERVKSGQKYLEAGCGCGQDIRKLIMDGAPPSSLIATDLCEDYWQVGFSLFNDASRLGVRFIAADVSGTSTPLTTPPPDGVAGTVDIIHASSFFHLFSRPQQIVVAQRLIRTLRPGPGTLMVGRQSGNKSPGEYATTIPHQDGKAGTTAVRHDEVSWVRHDKESWKKFWDEVGELTGSKWEVEHYNELEIEQKLIPFEFKGYIKQDWVVRRIS